MLNVSIDIHAHTHNRSMTLLDFVRDHPGEPTQKGKTRKVKPI